MSLYRAPETLIEIYPYMERQEVSGVGWDNRRWVCDPERKYNGRSEGFYQLKGGDDEGGQQIKLSTNVKSSLL